MAEDFDDDIEEGEEGSAGSKGGKKKLIILIVLPLLLLIGAAAGAYFTGMADSLLGKDAEHAATDEHGEATGGHGEAAGEHGVAGMPVFYELPEMLLNLNPGKSRRPSHLKIKVRLELASAADTPKVEAMLPRITDSFQVYLRELRVEDLQGAAGMYRLREELMMRVNRVAAPAKINDVLFQEVLVQ